MCKTNLEGKDVFVINKKKLNDENPLVAKYGSKLGKLICYVKSLIEIENSKIIIFSQWDDMLTLISKTLVDNNINNSFVKGNVWKRTSAINNFTNGPEKVIMLSLKNAASGTNLSNATHIFFVEPINASKEEINTIESQAIARACRIGQKEKVSIIRFLIEDTIEEEIYKNNYV
jgi:SNF2 family DNA or RNA helicase